MTKARFTSPLLLAWALTLAIGTGCPFDPKIPSARVVCFQPSDCPSSYVCEPVDSVGHPGLGICCQHAGCASTLPDAAIQQIEDAVRDAGVEAPTEAGGEAASPSCGNGRLDPGETCDPISSCPAKCPQVGCETYELQGSATTCNEVCVLKGTQTTCTSGDACCPPGCTGAQDTDCNCTCGNGIVEKTCGE